MYLITEDFFKNICDNNLKKKILKKCCEFSEMMLKKENQIRKLPKGFWVKKISNTDIFKFRLNSGDRILFTYIKSNIDDKKTILFLAFCNHDDQIRKGHAISKNSKSIKAKDLQIDRNYIDEDEVNESYVNKYIKYNYIDLENSISMVVEPEYIEAMCKNGNEDYIYYLTENQLDIIRDRESAILIAGSAGSGKTTVAIHKILTLENKCRVLYITNTQLLCEKVENLYKKFANKKNNNVEFYYLNKLYSKILGINIKEIANYENFKLIIEPIKKMKYRELKGIDTIDIYTEYRGILKGYLGLEAKEVKNIFKRKNNMLTIEDYLNIPKDYSIFTETEKIEIYQLCLEYCMKLNETKLIDSTDLPIRILQKIKNKEISLFQYIIIDEIQDLNEMEIYMLSQLVDDNKNIMFDGDIHQTVNPTFFDFGRLKNIYYGQGQSLNIHTLNKNYRNTIQIINILNKLASDRQKYIGRTKYDYIEQGIINGEEVHISNINKGNIKTLIKLVSKKHYCAIIVPNEIEKKKLLDICEDVEDRIFTINEIKGLEYENVYCFNIISSNIKEWNKIYSENVKNLSKYRYYFNSLYVALSRAKKNLYIFENDTNNCVINSLINKDFTKYKSLEEVNDKSLKICKESTKEDWIKESKRLEKIGQYNKSKFARNRSEEKRIININKNIDDSGIIVTSPKYNINDLQLIDIETNDDEVSKLVNIGFKYYQQRNYGKSLEFYEKALEIDNDNYKIYHCIANSFGYMIGGREKSIEFFNQSLKLNPSNFLASLDKASIESDLGRTSDTINTLKEALKYNPDVLNVYTQLVDEYMILYEKNHYNHINNKSCLKNIIKYCKLGLKSHKTVKWEGINKIWRDDIGRERERFLKSNLTSICSVAEMALNNKSFRKNFLISVIQYNQKF